MASLSVEFETQTEARIALYEAIRNGQSSSPFYDAVVLTAADGRQKAAFEAQLETMKGKLASCCKYHVVADPPGAKIGNGGATMEVMHQLDLLYGAQLEEMRILLVHAGGFSQRLPNVSVLGKAFGMLPVGGRAVTCLECCMIMFCQFPQRMSPGVFVCCSDVLLVFSLGGDWTLERPGITALAHPSPIEIGLTHGVFVLENQQEAVDALSAQRAATSESVSTVICSRFLHKPTEAFMREKGAIIPGKETIFTDSVFFFDHATGKLLREFYRNHKPLLDEIDAYGDFLQGMGTDATDEYVTNVVNVSKVTPDLVETRKKVFKLLRGVQFNTLLMTKSRFYHIGTTKEFIHHLCVDNVFRQEMACKSIASTTTAASAVNSEPKAKKANVDGELCLMASYFDDFNSCQLKSSLYLEYCDVGHNVSFGSSSIISQGVILDNTVVPSNCFLHTAFVEKNGQRGFVTFAIGIEDSTKAKRSEDEIGLLRYCGKTLNDLRACLDLPDDLRSLWTQEVTSFTLWNAQLFPVLPSSAASFQDAAQRVAAATGGSPYKQPTDMVFEQHMSMVDILEYKDTQSLLEWRGNLERKIASGQPIGIC